MVMTVLLTNNARSTLLSGINALQTEIRLLAGGGNTFPTITAPGQWFPITIEDSVGAIEIMRVIARSGDVFTVKRAQEGTTAKSFSANDVVELRLTVGAMQELVSDTHTNFGRIYMTPADGVDSKIGVPAGYYFNVRSPSDDSYVDEYQNVNGVAVATSKSYPSGELTQSMSEQIDRIGSLDYLSEQLDQIAVDKGWDASFVVDGNKTQQEINDLTRSKTPSIKDYGAKYDGSNDRQALIDCRAANEHFLVNSGTTNIEVFANERHAVGLGKPTVIVDPTTNPVAVQLLEGSVTENIDFVSSSDSKEWQRAEVKSNSIVKNVGFYNFKHASARPNAWGNYLENVRNIYYENCRYGRNSQSDITIIDNVQDVVINNAQNAEDGGVYLNIEPNTIGNISNINLIGGTYRKLTLLENSANNYGIKSIVVNGSRVKYLSYRGAEVSFINAQIDDIEGNFFGYSTVNGIDNAKLEFAGAISINNAALLSNKIQDEFLTDLDLAGSSAWEVYQSESTQQFGRTNTDSLRGDYTTLNIDKTGYTYASTRNFIDITESTALAFINRARVNNNPGTINVELALVRFYDSAETLLYTHIVYSNRSALGSNIGFRNDVAIIKKPTGAVKAKVSLRSRPDCSVDIARVGLFDIRLNVGGGNFNSVVASFANPVKTILKKSALPTGTFGLMYKFGDVLELPSGTQYHVATNGTATTQATFALIDKRKVYASFNAVTYNLLANETREIVRTVTGANIGDTVVVSYSQLLGVNSQVWAQVTAANTVSIYHKNFTAATISVSTNINVIVS